ncbi:MAG: DPP IV N-terminal domain-containing protein, partial [Chitinophagales bacterium]|nr:DPP IV N-terminal domain-containing protein [Chitinophagales bacterium]
MNNKLLSLSLLFVLLTYSISAQNNLLSIEDAVLRQRTTLAPQKLNQLQWIKGTNDFSYVEKESILIRGTVENTDRREVLSLIELNTELKKLNLDTVNIFPAILWKNGDEFNFTASQKSINYNFSTSSLAVQGSRDFGGKAENIDTEANKEISAFTVKNNLFISDGTTIKQITNDADSNIVNGQSVHREEFGIFKGTFWSPKGTRLAFYRMDQTMVTDYPIIDWTTQPARVTEIKYPMAGGKSHHVTLGVYDIASGKKIFLQTGEPAEQYLTNIEWSPDEQHVYIAVLNRDQNHLHFNSYNANTGAFEKTLFEESDEKYIQPLHPMVFIKHHPNLFIWQSARDG